MEMKEITVTLHPKHAKKPKKNGKKKFRAIAALALAAATAFVSLTVFAGEAGDVENPTGEINAIATDAPEEIVSPAPIIESPESFTEATEPPIIVEESAPSESIGETAPVSIENTKPAVEETAPVFETTAPIAEETAPAASYTSSATDAEITLLARLCMAEAENEPEEGQRMVIDTVLNRVDKDYWPDTISEVVWQRNQFSSMTNGRYDRCPQQDYFTNLVIEELAGRTDYDCVYFTAGGYGRYGTPYRQVGHHYFCTE